MLAVLGAYFGLTIGWWSSNEFIYQILNLSGAVGVAIDAYVDRNTQPVVLNVVWAAIALIGLVNAL